MQPQHSNKNAAPVVKSFARGLQVIRSFVERQSPLTITEVARASSLTRAGARRLLLTLQELGYVKLNGRHFSLTPRIMELGCAYTAADPMWSIAERHLHMLVNDIHETVSAAALDDLEVVYVLRLRTPRVLHLDLQSGSRLPAHITSVGRVLLAGLHPRQLERYFQRAVIEQYTARTITEPGALRAEIDNVRRHGYSIVIGEVEESICGVAVPLRERSGKVVAAVGVGLTRGRISECDLERVILPRVQSVAQAIVGQMSASPMPGPFAALSM